jgi:hypothetical protein
MGNEAVLWYYMQDAERRGPVEDGKLAQLLACGEVTPDTLLWNASLPGWVPARTIFDAPPSPAASLPPPQTSKGAQPASPPAGLKVLGGCGCFTVVLIIVAALAWKGAKDQDHVKRFMVENPSLTLADLDTINTKASLAEGEYSWEGFHREKILDTYYAFNLQKIPMQEWDDLMRFTTILAYSTQEDLASVGDSMAKLDVLLSHSHSALDHFVGGIQELQKTCPGPAKGIREFQASQVEFAATNSVQDPEAVVQYAVSQTAAACASRRLGN